MPIALGFAENSIQLVPDGTLILHVIIILVMVWLLNVTLYKPINQILANREKRTRGRMTEAEEISQSVSQKLSEYQRSLRQARAAAYAVTEAERAEAMKDRQAKLNAMREELAESIAQEKMRIEQQAEEARNALRFNSEEIAADISKRILGRPEPPKMVRLGDLM